MKRSYIKVTADNRVSLITEPSNMSDQLSVLQEAVGGYIEVAHVDPDGLIVICNEDGMFEGVPLNKVGSVICGVPIVGTVVLMLQETVDGEESFAGFVSGDA